MNNGIKSSEQLLLRKFQNFTKHEGHHGGAKSEVVAEDEDNGLKGSSSAKATADKKSEKVKDGKEKEDAPQNGESVDEKTVAEKKEVKEEESK